LARACETAKLPAPIEVEFAVALPAPSVPFVVPDPAVPPVDCAMASESTPLAVPLALAVEVASPPLPPIEPSPPVPPKDSAWL
jgi:hypothetical protein